MTDITSELAINKDDDLFPEAKRVRAECATRVLAWRSPDPGVAACAARGRNLGRPAMSQESAGSGGRIFRWRRWSRNVQRLDGLVLTPLGRVGGHYLDHKVLGYGDVALLSKLMVPG